MQLPREAKPTELNILSWTSKEQGPAKQVLSLKFVFILLVSSLRQDYIGKMINFLQDFSCLAVIDVIRAVPANRVSRTGEIVGTRARNNSSQLIKAICTFSLVTKECTSSCRWDPCTPPCSPGSVHTSSARAGGVCCPAEGPGSSSGCIRQHTGHSRATGRGGALEQRAWPAEIPGLPGRLLCSPGCPSRDRAGQGLYPA